MRIKALILSILIFAIPSGGDTPRFKYSPGRIQRPAALYRSDTLTIRVIGDVMMHTKQIETACISDSTYDFSSYFSLIKDSLSNADICIANMEFTLAGKPYTGYPAFSAPDCFIEYLAECGIDIFLGANNHIYDKRCKGLQRTIDRLEALKDKGHDIDYCGIAADSAQLRRTTPLKLRSKGMSISLANFTYGTNLGADKQWPKVNYMSDKEQIAEALNKASSSDLTLALPHWGEEYRLLPSDQQKAIAKWLASEGADIIIGSHPHVPQTFEYIEPYGVPVAYSLGNAVSNMSAENTQMELMATIRLVREPNGNIRLLPPGFTYLWCSRPGGFGKSYTVIPVKHFIGKKHLWSGSWDYDKMINTYNKVKNTIKIEDF